MSLPVRIDNYRFERNLGNGTFGKVKCKYFRDPILSNQIQVTWSPAFPAVLANLKKLIIHFSAILVAVNEITGHKVAIKILNKRKIKM